MEEIRISYLEGPFGILEEVLHEGGYAEPDSPHLVGQSQALVIDRHQEQPQLVRPTCRRQRKERPFHTRRRKE